MASTRYELREEVRRRYAESAKVVTGESDGCGCGVVLHGRLGGERRREREVR